MRERWTPAAQGAAIIGGGLLSLLGLRDRSLLGLVLAAGGVALLLRAAANRPLEQLVGRERASANESATYPVAPTPESAMAAIGASGVEPLPSTT